MTRLEAAIVDLTAFLDEERIPYMIIGGFANLHWGVERFTRDIDITIEIDDGRLEHLIRRLGGRFKLPRGDTLAFARLNHLIRIDTQNGVPADLIIAALPYETAAIRRAATVPVAGRTIRLCAAEDLIVHKLASERLQDAADVEGIVLRRSKHLDREYLATRIAELAAGLEQPEILDRYRKLLARADALDEPD
jgi:hypothetical protein